MRYRDRKIESVAKMLGALKQQANTKQTIWFRGQAKANWKLVPSLARHEAHLKAESALIKRFMQNAAPHIASPPRDEWEWIFLMQHHRAPTRLLDWSESPLAALYFAVQEKVTMTAAGAVWCLDPVALNKEANLKFGFELEIPAFGRDAAGKLSSQPRPRKSSQALPRRNCRPTEHPANGRSAWNLHNKPSPSHAN